MSNDSEKLIPDTVGKDRRHRRTLAEIDGNSVCVFVEKMPDGSYSSPTAHTKESYSERNPNGSSHIQR